MTESVFSEAYARFRELLIEARLGSDLTQEDVAERLNKPQSFISKYERGERRLDVIEFLHVARALELNPVDVVADLVRTEGR